MVKEVDWKSRNCLSTSSNPGKSYLRLLIMAGLSAQIGPLALQRLGNDRNSGVVVYSLLKVI